jgi:flavin reductase (DIM6/NTAB) family NADH-FMN oxidoreductase RutF
LDVRDQDPPNDAQRFIGGKVDVPDSGYDRLACPVSTAVVITTIDEDGRVNAAPVATCLRNNHKPTCF